MRSFTRAIMTEMSGIGYNRTYDCRCDTSSAGALRTSGSGRNRLGDLRGTAARPGCGGKETARHLRPGKDGGDVAVADTRKMESTDWATRSDNCAAPGCPV